MFAQEVAEIFGQEAVDGVGVGEYGDLGVEAAGIGSKVGMHLFELGEDLPRMTQE